MSGRLIKLLGHHYDVPGKSRVSDIGLAIDAARKEEVILLGAVLSSQYDPHDYCLDGFYHEIKSSAGTWLSVPNSEVEFGVEQVALGKDVIYDILLQLDMHNAKFLGQTNFATLYHYLEPSKFLTWRKLESGWIQERSFRVLLSKIIPLLS